MVMSFRLWPARSRPPDGGAARSRRPPPLEIAWSSTGGDAAAVPRTAGAARLAREPRAARPPVPVAARGL
jgi:hypothetical protein